MAFISTLLLLIVPYIIVFALISGTGIGAGYLLRWLVGIDLDSAIISGMIVASASAYFVLRIYSLIFPVVADSPFGEDDDEPSVVYVSESLGKRSRRKRK